MRFSFQTEGIWYTTTTKLTDIDDDETERTEKSVGEEEKRREGRGLDQAKVEESDLLEIES